MNDPRKIDEAQYFYERAQKVFPGGVTAAARLNRYLNRPFFVSRGEGSRLFDLEGKSYIDMNMSYGASLLGHGHPKIREALAEAGRMGIACGMEYPAQTELAEKLCYAVPSAEMVRFTGTGTETTWNAIRLARVCTDRIKVVKLEGHFHGFNDYLQFNYWPKQGDNLPRIHAESPGFPPESDDHIIVLPYNDEKALETAIAESGEDIAAVILEPVNYNSGCILPRKGYLQKVRELTERNGILLIFDEILSGFRTGTDCIQGYYGIIPDLTTLGKALGGGVPLSAFVGRKEFMKHVSPLGTMMHSGTYNANAVNIYCGNAFMDIVADPGIYQELLDRSDRLYRGMNDAFVAAGLPAKVNGLGCRFGILFGKPSEQKPESYIDVIGQDWKIAYAFFLEAYNRGVFFNNGWHHGISFAHSDEDIERVVEVTGEAAVAAAV